MKRILCFGDSNTYGYKPDRSGQFNENIRWTGLLSKSLGDDFTIIEDGVCGRTLALDDPMFVGKKEIKSIENSIRSNSPIDLLIIMLGTNDLKYLYRMAAEKITENCGKLIDKAISSCENPDSIQILLISPILLGENILSINSTYNAQSVKTSHSLAKEFENLAKKKNCYFLAAENYAVASDVDCEHMTAAEHKKLATAIEKEILKIFK